MANPIVRQAQWGVEIEREAASSKIIPAMRALAEEAKKQSLDKLLEATTDEARREYQLLARSYNETIRLIDEVLVRAKAAIERLEREEHLDQGTPD